ncbi:MAG TPA: class II glutamine amidotransferase [Planctomycetes bacterium]|nr:class II glutamine amidotransferase [Planctomycetota bacterium]
MCRFALYLGSKITLQSILIDPDNSIVNQSIHSKERSEPLNGDGFGIAWYVEGHAAPALFKDVTPAWNNQNLRNISRVTETRTLLAHVRAASPGLAVQPLNCHPFVSENLSFMHNGVVGDFRGIRRALLASLDDEAFHSIQGTTDSEHLFAIATQHHRECEASSPIERLASSLRAAIHTSEDLRARAGAREPSHLNLVLCDGERAAVTRYCSSPDEEPPSLHVHASGCRYTCEGGTSRMVAAAAEHSAVLIASEPLSDDGGWSTVPRDHIVTVDEAHNVVCEAI